MHIIIRTSIAKWFREEFCDLNYLIFPRVNPKIIFDFLRFLQTNTFCFGRLPVFINVGIKDADYNNVAAPLQLNYDGGYRLHLTFF